MWEGRGEDKIIVRQCLTVFMCSPVPSFCLTVQHFLMLWLQPLKAYQRKDLKQDKIWLCALVEITKTPQTEHTANINRMTFSMSTPCQICKPQPCSGGGFMVHPSNLSCFVAVRPFAHSKIARPQPDTSKPQKLQLEDTQGKRQVE